MLPGAGPVRVAVGATLLTTRLKVVLLLAPSESVAVMVTVALSSGPSAVLNDQLQVPLAFLTTVPLEALSVTTSAPGSPQVPLLEAVCPSLTVTVALLAATLGATLLTM